MHRPRIDTIIEFGKSSSPQYGRTAARARRFPGYECIGDGRTMLHRIRILERVELVKAAPILEAIKSWRSGALYYKGDRVPFAEALRRIDCARHVKNPSHIRWWCCEGHDTAVYPPETFGCRCVRLGTRFWHGDAWWKYGEMVDPVTFKVDKRALRTLVSAALAREYLQLCPHFRISTVLNAIDRLPDMVDAQIGQHWEIEYRTHGDQQIPRGIRPRRSWYERARDAAQRSVWRYPTPDDVQRFIRDVERGNGHGGTERT